MQGKILEVYRICGKCWEEDGTTTPMYQVDKDDEMVMRVHNHKDMKMKKEILEALKDKNG